MAGSQVFIEYGGGHVASHRFLQDYGFLDPRASRRNDREFVQSFGQEAREALQSTSLSDDLALLSSADAAEAEELGPKGRLAVQFRVALRQSVELGPPTGGSS